MKSIFDSIQVIDIFNTNGEWSIAANGAITFDSGNIFSDGVGNLTLTGGILESFELSTVGEGCSIHNDGYFNSDAGNLFTDGSGTLTLQSLQSYNFQLNADGSASFGETGFLIDHLGNTTIYAGLQAQTFSNAGNFAIDSSGNIEAGSININSYQIYNSGGDLNVSGNVFAAAFSGDGSSLTGVLTYESDPVFESWLTTGDGTNIAYLGDLSSYLTSGGTMYFDGGAITSDGAGDLFIGGQLEFAVSTGYVELGNFGSSSQPECGFSVPGMILLAFSASTGFMSVPAFTSGGGSYQAQAPLDLLCGAITLGNNSGSVASIDASGNIISATVTANQYISDYGDLVIGSNAATSGASKVWIDALGQFSFSPGEFSFYNDSTGNLFLSNTLALYIDGHISTDSNALYTDGAGNLTAATVNAGNGFTGTGTYSTFTITNGIITAAS